MIIYKIEEIVGYDLGFSAEPLYADLSASETPYFPAVLIANVPEEITRAYGRYLQRVALYTWGMRDDPRRWNPQQKNPVYFFISRHVWNLRSWPQGVMYPVAASTRFWDGVMCVWRTGMAFPEKTKRLQRDGPYFLRYKERVWFGEVATKAPYTGKAITITRAAEIPILFEKRGKTPGSVNYWSFGMSWLENVVEYLDAHKGYRTFLWDYAKVRYFDFGVALDEYTYKPQHKHFDVAP